MIQKITKILEQLLKDRVWKIVLFSMISVLILSSVYYFINLPNPSRGHIAITPKEFKTGKINDDLTATDEVESEAKFEDYNLKYNSLKAKLPKAEWLLTEKRLTKAEYNRELVKYDKEMDSYIDLVYNYGIDASQPIRPDSVKVLNYSMKTFLDEVYSSLDIDSTDFDSKIKTIDKIDHFYSMTDKKGGDTLLFEKFKNIISNSKNLTIEEIQGVEKLHNSITKTKLVFSLTEVNNPFERQDQLFGLYEAAANADITPDRFELLDSLVLRLTNQKKFKDTVVVLDVMKTVMNLDFSKYKEKGESVDELEIECAKLFFNDPTIKFDEKDVIEKLNKYSSLYSTKIEAANLEKKAREILRKENRNKATDFMYFGFFFTCICVMIVQLIRQNNKKD
jgi:hypothetical protein